ncbi:hypothetical protein ACVWWL_003163 [Bradyrhizobium sp. USDA 3696]
MVVVAISGFVMSLVDDRRILVDRVRRMGVRAMTVIIVMLDRVARGVAGMRAEQRDQASQNGAQQRQEDDCLDHDLLFPHDLVGKPVSTFPDHAISPSSD